MEQENPGHATSAFTTTPIRLTTAAALTDLKRELKNDRLITSDSTVAIRSLAKSASTTSKEELLACLSKLAQLCTTHLGNSFAACLNLAVYYTLVRDVENAKDILTKLSALAVSQQEIRETTYRRMVLRRLGKFQKKPLLSSRDWFYILYGGLLLSEDALLNTPQDNGTSYDYTRSVSYLLVLARGILEELGLEFDVIEFYNSRSQPLAQSLATMLDLPATAYVAANSSNRALLVTTSPNDLPAEQLTLNTKQRTIFTGALCTYQNAVVTPDIAGCLSPDPPAYLAEFLQTPFVDGSLPNLKSDRLDLPNEHLANLVDNILTKVGNIESKPEVIKTIQEIADYYRTNRDLLTLGNTEVFPERPEYTAEIPA